MMGNEMKIRTTGELSVMIKAIGILVLISSVWAFTLVRNILGFIIVFFVPALYTLASWFVVKRSKNALMMNTIDGSGVKNAYLGSVACEMYWSEIGDFGVVEVKDGLYKGRYVYMSRVFVNNSIRRNIIKQYDPRVCIVIPYTEAVCKKIGMASGGKIEFK